MKLIIYFQNSYFNQIIVNTRKYKWFIFIFDSILTMNLIEQHAFH